jgi:hypothetical protein
MMIMRRREPEPPLSPHEFKALEKLVRTNNLSKLRATVADTPALNSINTHNCDRYTLFGLQTLRRLATKAAEYGKKEMVEYFCMERGVKVSAISGLEQEGRRLQDPGL